MIERQRSSATGGADEKNEYTHASGKSFQKTKSMLKTDLSRGSVTPTHRSGRCYSSSATSPHTNSKKNI